MTDFDEMKPEPPFRAVVAPRRKRLSDAIVEQVEAMIVDGTLSPGHALPAERLLAEKFGVSRPSLREALLRLESKGLLTVARGGGFVVTDVTAPTITDPLVHLLQRHPDAELDIIELRHGLELVSAHFAALRSTKDDHLRLRRAHEQLGRQQQSQDPLAAAQADAAFHLAVAEASHNVALIHVMHGLHNLLRTSMRHMWDLMYAEPDSLSVVRGQHQALLDAVVAGDADRARDAAHLHLHYVRESLAQHETAGGRAGGKSGQKADAVARARRRPGTPARR